MNTGMEFEKLIKIACSSDATVLIRGATGTGKTTLAKEIHQQSLRRAKPFVPINLATLHEGVLESELFGHEKGAFTGADQRRMGKLGLAQGGTVFLDEVSELSPRLQARLLEFLQFRTLSPVGSNRELHLDVRIIVATHRDLDAAVLKGEFREDLLHRMRVILIPLKSLKDRVDEFDTLVHDCLQAVAVQAQRSILRISEAVARKFETYSWPGNLRELRNVLEFAVLASEGAEITLEDLPAWFHGGCDDEMDDSIPNFEEEIGVLQVPCTWNYKGTMERVERAYLNKALLKNQGHVIQTARKIGLNKMTLMRRMERYGLSELSSCE